MDAGSLDRRITLQHRSLAAEDAYGQKVASYVAYDTVWAEKVDIKGREYFAAQQTSAQVTTRFRIRHRTDILLTDRIVYGGLSYNINQVSEIGRKEGLEIFATAVVA